MKTMTPPAASTSTLVTHKVLCKHLGANGSTPRDPVAPYVEGAVDMTAKKTVCTSYDFDMPIDIDMYEVRDVTLPAWLPVGEWLRDTTGWKYTWGLGVDPTLPESWQRGLKEIEDEAERYAAAKLLKTKTFRSPFRKSLRDQIVAWCENTESWRFDSPLSGKQWDALVTAYDVRAAEGASEQLYRDRYETGCKVAALQTPLRKKPLPWNHVPPLPTKKFESNSLRRGKRCAPTTHWS